VCEREGEREPLARVRANPFRGGAEEASDSFTATAPIAIVSVVCLGGSKRDQERERDGEKERGCV
jgi:hypothetical protein